MIKYQDWNIKALGEIAILSIVLLTALAAVIFIVSPVLHLVFPGIFGPPISVAEGLLFLILLKLHHTK